MIEKLFRLGARLRLTPQANALLDRPIDHLVLGHGCEHLIERRVGRLLVDLFQPQVALQSLSANGPLLHAQRGIAVRKPRIIQITVFAEAFDNSFDSRFGRASTFEQALSQFLDRARLGSQQLARALKDAFAGFRRIERRRYLAFPCQRRFFVFASSLLFPPVSPW